MLHTIVRTASMSLVFAILPVSEAFAHCFVGARFLPATLITDDPCIADEMSLPTMTYLGTPGMPAGKEVDIEGDISKRITADFGVTVAETWTQVRTPGAPTMAGFNDLVTTFQYQVLKDGPHELALMVGLIVDWGGTGATNAGIGSSFSTLSPTLYVGKGFGELPDALNWAKPFAVTFEASYDIPTSSFDFAARAFIPQTVSYSASLQYSLPYLHANIIDLGLPDFLNHLIPIVEVSFVTPVANNFGNSFVTTGFISPGVIWIGDYFQVGAEAILPVNNQSGSGVGVVGQLHLYLDDIFPTTYGQPLIGASTPPPKLPFRG